MSRRARTRAEFGVWALAIGSTFAMSSALAADSPAGTYETKGQPYTVSFDAKGNFTSIKARSCRSRAPTPSRPASSS